MKRFRFPLESARWWRETQLALEEAKYRLILARIGAATRSIEDLQETAAQERRALRSAATLQGGQLAQFEDFQRFAGQEMRRLQAECKRWQEEAARQLEKRNLADRNLQLLEKLKETQRAEWRIEEGKELQELADEAYSARLARLMAGK